MIGKRAAGRAAAGVPVARQVRDLASYIDRAGREQDRGEVLAIGAENMMCHERQSQVAEMSANAIGVARARTPIEHIILSWREEEQPDSSQVRAAVGLLLDETGLSGHQALWALHRAANTHLHVVVSRVAPDAARVTKFEFAHNAIGRAVARIEHAQGWQPEIGARFTVTQGEIDNGNPERPGTAPGHTQLRGDRGRGGTPGHTEDLGLARTQPGSGGPARRDHRRIGDHERQAGPDPAAPAALDPSTRLAHVVAAARLRAAYRIAPVPLHPCSTLQAAGMGAAAAHTAAARTARAIGVARLRAADLAFVRERVVVRGLAAARGTNAAPSRAAAAAVLRAGPARLPGADLQRTSWTPDVSAGTEAARDRAARQGLASARADTPAASAARVAATARLRAEDTRTARERAVMTSLVLAGRDAPDARVARLAAEADLRASYRALPAGAVVAERLDHREDALSTEAAAVETRQGVRSAERIAIEVAGPLIDGATSWTGLHVALAKEGIEYRIKGSGAVMAVGDQVVKASTYRKGALAALTKRFGPYEASTAPVVSRAVEAAPGAAPPTGAAVVAHVARAERVRAAFEAETAPIAFAPALARAVSNAPPLPGPDARALALAAGEPAPALAPLARPAPRPHDPASPLGQLHAALGATAYTVLLRRPAGAGAGRRGEVMQIGPAPVDAVAARWPAMARLAEQRGSVHVVPWSQDWHYVTLGGLSPAAVRQLADDGHVPALVVDTGDEGIEAVLMAPRDPDDELDDEAAERIARRLMAAYGRRAAQPGIRLPGTPSWRRTVAGGRQRSGSVRVLASRPLAACGQLGAFIRRLAAQMRAGLAGQLGRSAPAPRTAYEAHRQDLVRGLRGVRPDDSRIDAMIARRLRATGHAYGEIALILAQEAPRVDPGRHRPDWLAYAAKAAGTAFTHEARLGIGQAQARGDVGRWRTLEPRVGQTLSPAAAQASPTAVPPRQAPAPAAPARTVPPRPAQPAPRRRGSGPDIG